MLKAKNNLGISIHKRFVLLFFISLITYQSNVFASSKEIVAEDYRIQGYAEQQKGNLNAALSFYTKSVALGNDNPAVYNDIGVIYETIGLPGKAEEKYLQAIKIDQKYLPAYTNLAYLYKNQGDTERAFRYFKKRYEFSEQNDSWTQEVKEEILKIRPEYYAWIVTLEADKMNRELEAQAHADFLSKVKIATEHYEKGEEFYKKGKLQQAIDEYNIALRFTPGNPKALKGRKKAMLEIARENLKIHADMAIKMLDSGDSFSAKKEIQKMLATIPNEANFKSRY